MKKRGFTALLAVIIIATILELVALALSARVMGIHTRLHHTYLEKQSHYTALSCARIAILNLELGYALEDSLCDIEKIEDTINAYTLRVQTEYGGSHTTLEVVVETQSGEIKTFYEKNNQ